MREISSSEESTSLDLKMFVITNTKKELDDLKHSFEENLSLQNFPDGIKKLIAYFPDEKEVIEGIYNDITSDKPNFEFIEHKLFGKIRDTRVGEMLANGTYEKR